MRAAERQVRVRGRLARRRMRARLRTAVIRRQLRRDLPVPAWNLPRCDRRMLLPIGIHWTAVSSSYGDRCEKTCQCQHGVYAEYMPVPFTWDTLSR